MKVLGCYEYELSKASFTVYDYLSPHQPLALSVVSMALLSPHKMAEIRPGHGHERLPDPRMRVPPCRLGETSKFTGCSSHIQQPAGTNLHRKSYT